MRRSAAVVASSEEVTWHVMLGSLLRSAESARACLYQKRRSDIMRVPAHKLDRLPIIERESGNL